MVGRRWEGDAERDAQREREKEMHREREMQREERERFLVSLLMRTPSFIGLGPYPYDLV